MSKDRQFSTPARPFPIRNNTRDILSLRARAIAIICAICITITVLGSRLATVSLSHPNDPSPQITSSSPIIHTQRAEITDRNGELLAVNLSTASLYANPKQILDAKEATKQLRTVFNDLDEQDTLRKLTSDKSFIWIKRNITPKEQLSVNTLGIPGIYFAEEEKRVYTQGPLFSHMLGYIDVDGKGIAGIEKYFDTRLTHDTTSLALSVDMRVQSILHDVITRSISKFSAIGGTGIIVDVDSGEILSMVSLPDFDPHHPGSASPESLFNRASSGVYEMGSTFKTFTMAMALENKTTTLDTLYDVHAPLQIGHFLIRDFHTIKPMLTASEVFMYSSNIGTAQIARAGGRDLQKRFLRQLGVLDPLSVEIPETAAPLYPSNWKDVNMMTISYGHGIAVTPLHLVQATASIVNGGIFRPLTFVKHATVTEGRRVLSKETSRTMRRLLYEVVTEGTGEKSNIKGYFVGGKTGTAEKAQSGSYNRKALLSSFIGVFPMYHPRYIVYVMLDEPKGIKETGGYATGGMVAAPAVREVIERMAPLVGISPVGTEDTEKDAPEKLLIDFAPAENDNASF